MVRACYEMMGGKDFFSLKPAVIEPDVAAFHTRKKIADPEGIRSTGPRIRLVVHTIYATIDHRNYIDQSIDFGTIEAFAHIIEELSCERNRGLVGRDAARSQPDAVGPLVGVVLAALDQLSSFDLLKYSAEDRLADDTLVTQFRDDQTIVFKKDLQDAKLVQTDVKNADLIGQLDVQAVHDAQEMMNQVAFQRQRRPPRRLFARFHSFESSCTLTSWRGCWPHQWGGAVPPPRRLPKTRPDSSSNRLRASSARYAGPSRLSQFGLTQALMCT